VNNRFSETVLEMLTEAGRFLGRDVIDSVKMPEEFEIFPAAIEALKEFGHLRVGEEGDGIECARSTIVFEPTLASGDWDWFSFYSNLLQTSLYPLGEVNDDNIYLSVDPKGRVFLVWQDLMFVDDNFDKALEKILTGVRVRLVDDNGELADYIP
jgi:hypothetical protein